MEQGSFQKMMNPDHDLYSEAEISRDLYERLHLAGDFEDDEVEAAAEVAEVAEQEEEEEFSFMFGGESTSIAADDVFMNGEIRPVFPLFNRDLLFSGGDDGDSESDSVSENLPMRPPVKRVFVETNEPGQVISTIPENDEIAGPYCEWSSSKKAVAPPPESCKKSNSTGFSKIWRIKEFVGRSNSDGRDAFVFLNNSHAPPPTAVKKAEEKSEKKETTAAVKSNHPVKKSGKQPAPLSAHEVYLRSKAKDEVRRRSFLPYRPELMGFFTTVNGGLTKNVHPY